MYCLIIVINKFVEIESFKDKNILKDIIIRKFFKVKRFFYFFLLLFDIFILVLNLKGNGIY